MSVTALVGCVEATGPVAPTVGQEFTLAPGQTTGIVGTPLTVRFTGVAQDSRCPLQAACFWAGDGAVVVVVSGAAFSRTDTLHTNLPPRATDLDAYRVTLVALAPYPIGAPIPLGDYRATLVVSLP